MWSIDLLEICDQLPGLESVSDMYDSSVVGRKIASIPRDFQAADQPAPPDRTVCGLRHAAVARSLSGDRHGK